MPMNNNIGSGTAELRPASRDVDATSTETFLGVYDFSYAPYALGDCLTWQENALVEAMDQGYQKIRLCVVADPDRPLQQSAATYQYPRIIAISYENCIQLCFPVR